SLPDPVGWFLGVLPFSILEGASDHPAIQFLEAPTGHSDPEVVRPAADHGVHFPQQSANVFTPAGLPFFLQLFPDRRFRFTARFDQELVAALRVAYSVVADVEPEEVEPFRQMDNPGLFWGEGQSTFAQPFRQDFYRFGGVFFAFTEDHEVVRIADHCSW